MHAAVRDFVARQQPIAGNVVEFGSRDINGNVRDLLGPGDYLGIDLEAGPNVDEVADVTQLRWEPIFDVVLCLEVLEHAPDAAAVCDAARDALKPGGRLIMTCATYEREPHSGLDGGALRAGEHYENIDHVAFIDWVRRWGDYTFQFDREDLRAVVVKR